MYKALNLLVFCIIIFFVCCGENSSQNGTKISVESMVIQSQQKGVPHDNGKNIYMKYCLACHQVDGSGVPGMYPPIQKSNWVSGDKNKIIKVVLEGLKGPIEVNGEEYDQTMAQHNFLTDQQIADVLTYIRQNFGNKADAISGKEVAKLRKPSPN